MKRQAPGEISKISYLTRIGKLSDSDVDKMSSDLRSHLILKLDQLGLEEFTKQKEQIIKDFLPEPKEKKKKK